MRQQFFSVLTREELCVLIIMQFVILKSAFEIGCKYQHLSFCVVFVGVTCVGVKGATLEVGLPGDHPLIYFSSSRVLNQM